ncbi:MAG TPA: DUF4398 domain-containing protein [Polyangiaceae bacterium]|nr:DUF4398 domain-containing protein [Polyangiaceae bacterium]
MRWLETLAVASVTSLAMGCASSATTPPEMSQTKSTVRAAEEVGAQNVPRAALHLKMARDQVATAEQLIADNEGEMAYWVLQRAEADAELAMALAREVSYRQEAMEAAQRIERLKQETD